VPLISKSRSDRDSSLKFKLKLSKAKAGEVPASVIPFVDAGVVSTGGASEGVAMADINADGIEDVAFTNYSSTVELYRNATDSEAQKASLVAAGSLALDSGPGKLLVADLNRDGRPDLLTPSVDINRLDIYLNITADGSDNFSFEGTSFQLPDWGWVNEACAADFDGDGIVDVAGVNQGSTTGKVPSRVFVYKNSTAVGASSPALTLAFTGTPSAVDDYAWPTSAVCADFNGDGKPDLASGNGSGVGVLLNQSAYDGSDLVLSAPTSFASNAGAVTAMAVGDFNGDGKPDLVTADGNTGSSQGDQWTVYLNQTDVGARSPSFSVTTRGGNLVYGVTTADINADGYDDVLITALGDASSADGSVDVYMAKADGSGDFEPVTRTFWGDELHAVAAGDLNGDGKPDFVAADAATGSATVRFQTQPDPDFVPEVNLVDAKGVGTLNP